MTMTMAMTMAMAMAMPMVAAQRGRVAAAPDKGIVVGHRTPRTHAGYREKEEKRGERKENRRIKENV